MVAHSTGGDKAELISLLGGLFQTSFDNSQLLLNLFQMTCRDVLLVATEDMLKQKVYCVVVFVPTTAIPLNARDTDQLFDWTFYSQTSDGNK